MRCLAKPFIHKPAGEQSATKQTAQSAARRDSQQTRQTAQNYHQAGPRRAKRSARRPHGGSTTVKAVAVQATISGDIQQSDDKRSPTTTGGAKAAKRYGITREGSKLQKDSQAPGGKEDGQISFGGCGGPGGCGRVREDSRRRRDPRRHTQRGRPDEPRRGGEQQESSCCPTTTNTEFRQTTEGWRP